MSRKGEAPHVTGGSGASSDILNFHLDTPSKGYVKSKASVVVDQAEKQCLREWLKLSIFFCKSGEI